MSTHLDTKRLIDTARQINDSNIAGTAVVRSEKFGEPFDGPSPVGLSYRGQTIPPPLQQYIERYASRIRMWPSNGEIRAFVSPKPKHHNDTDS